MIELINHFVYEIITALPAPQCEFSRALLHSLIPRRLNQQFVKAKVRATRLAVKSFWASEDSLLRLSEFTILSMLYSRGRPEGIARTMATLKVHAVMNLQLAHIC